MLRVRINPRIFTLPMNTGSSGGGYSTMNYKYEFKNIVWRVMEEGDNEHLGEFYVCLPCFGKIGVITPVYILKRDAITVTKE